jgi:hypothetical protein
VIRLVLLLALLAGPAAAGNDDRLPDGEVAYGPGRIAAAWLVGPTERYRHGVLGDAIEAGGLAVRLAGGRELRVDLPPDSVFEDRYPRLVGDQLVVVRSDLNAGAALTLWGLEHDELKLLAESAPLGRPNRWLNPIGMADFDGDGAPEIAAVVTPHLAGILTLYRRDGDRLVKVFEAAGFSNHQIGSRELRLAAVADFDHDGVPDIGLPSLDRRTFILLSLRDGRLRVLRTIALPGPAEAVEAVGGNGALAVRVGDWLVALPR